MKTKKEIQRMIAKILTAFTPFTVEVLEDDGRNTQSSGSFLVKVEKDG